MARKMKPGEFDAKVVLEVTLTKYEKHCSSSPKAGHAVADLNMKLGCY